jgi:ATP-binding cassette subfamily C (CFTR/MRP) protein 4
MGKLINMLAGDFNTMETKLTMLFAGLTFPVTLIAAAVILVNRLGWIGLVCIGVPLCILPFQGLIGSINGKILRKVNGFKDRRVKITSEIIEGIRFIKLYAW